MADEARDLNTALNQHALDALRQLVAGSNEQEQAQNAEALENASINELDDEITRLQAKKEKLQQELKSMKTKTVKEIVLKELEDKIIKHKTSSLPEDVVKKVPIVNKKRQIDLLKITQAICGFTAFEHEDELVLRLETCYEGKYYEHYQIYLKLTKSDNLKISHHTIPFFIPLDRIQAAHLNTDLKTFIHVMSDYLNSYVSRRQQVLNLEGREYVHRLQSSMASDYVTVEVDHENKKYLIQLYYETLLNTFPTKVEIFTLDADRNKTKAHHLYPHFTSLPLHVAFTRAFPPIEQGESSTADDRTEKRKPGETEDESLNESVETEKANGKKKQKRTDGESRSESDRGTRKGKGKGKAKEVVSPRKSTRRAAAT